MRKVQKRTKRRREDFLGDEFCLDSARNPVRAENDGLRDEADRAGFNGAVRSTVRLSENKMTDADIGHASSLFA